MIDARSLTDALNGKWFGDYGLAYCPAHENTKTPALSLRNSERGDLLAYCHAGCPYADVRDALQAKGFLGPWDELRAVRPGLRKKTCPSARSVEQHALAVKRRQSAAALWDSAQTIAGSPAMLYLKGRAITANLPPTLRYLTACPHPAGVTLPALLGRVDGAVGFALHRTYLTGDGHAKTKTMPDKAMLGSCRGGAVRLSSFGHFAQGAPLVVTEGIENGLSLLSGQLDQPATVWAALSTSGITSLTLPRHRGHLIIAADGDVAGQRAARKLGIRATDLGWRVSHMTPPDGTDWNDLLIKAGDAA